MQQGIGTFEWICVVLAGEFQGTAQLGAAGARWFLCARDGQLKRGGLVVDEQPTAVCELDAHLCVTIAEDPLHATPAKKLRSSLRL